MWADNIFLKQNSTHEKNPGMSLNIWANVCEIFKDSD